MIRLMSLEQLRIFVFVAERLHMTRAAQALGLTQSAVSAAIKTLESELRTPLFDRIGRGLALSEAGQVFVPEARAVLLRARAAEQALDDLAGLRRGVLSLAASLTVTSYWLPGIVARFADAHPGVAVRIRAGNSAETARAVLGGDAELGFVEGLVDDWALLRRVVGGDRIALYAAPAHPLAGAPLEAGRLREVHWALREPGSGTRAHFERMMAERGLAPDELRLALELPSNEAALSAAADSRLVTAVSELAAEPFVATGRVVRLELELEPRRFELLVHKERRLSAAAKAFLSQLPAPQPAVGVSSPAGVAALDKSPAAGEPVEREQRR
jgi:DNA-binding transcriptional LysR family regulator